MNAYKIFFKDLFLDTIGEILFFPVWWYGRGLKKTAFFCWKKVVDGWQMLALSIFIRNFFKPMYGQKGWDAYILSLAIHLIQVLYRLFLMLLWALFWVFVLVTWIVLPIFIIYEFIF